MKKIIVSLSLIFTVCSCTKVNHGDFFSEVMIHYVDSSGNDLFTNGYNGYFQDSVKVYEFINGIKTVVPLPSDTINPSGYFSNIFSSSVVIDGGANSYNDIINQYTENIIHLKPGVDDTVKIHLTSTRQLGAIYDYIWYNGVLKKTPNLPYDSLTNSNFFTIVK